MAWSMTGFGRGQIIWPDRKCNIEIKSVNSKYCDIQIRLPRILNGLENRVRETVTKALHRGKIDVYVYYEDNRENTKTVTVDLPLVKAYQNAFKEISSIIGSDDHIVVSQIMQQNDVLQIQTAQLQEDETWVLVSQALESAVGAITAMRKSEGDALVSDVIGKCALIDELRLQIAQRSPFVLSDYRNRLRQRIEELAGDLVMNLIDEQRLALEVAIFTDKCAIDEELVRLESHMQQLRSTLGGNASVGKKSDFIMQEINREINTIGSKANDITITNCVVEMKTILEKIREQIQNLE